MRHRRSVRVRAALASRRIARAWSRVRRWAARDAAAAARFIARAWRAVERFVTLSRGWLRSLAARLWRLGIAGARVAAAVVIVSLVLAGGVFAASRLYGQFGGQQDVTNARSWANRAEAYAATSCRTCHAEQVDAKVAGLHVSVTCESCHGPLGTHPGSDPNVLTRLDTPTSAVCITCHASTEGRPLSFPAIVTTTHYSGGVCLRCHDPHTIVAVAPPDVTHPLADLPACTTCHNPDGLKKVPAGHEMVGDVVCLSCHATPNDVH